MKYLISNYVFTFDDDPFFKKKNICIGSSKVSEKKQVKKAIQITYLLFAQEMKIELCRSL